jgi:uncharacterized membrane protein YcaP (DUF421 family)
MKKEEIYLGDIKRILFGSAPPEFLLEVFIRTLIIYLALLVTLRLLGKRMDGHLTIMELAVMVMLGAIVAPAMQMPERGLLAGIFILLLTLGVHRGLAILNFKRPKTEELAHGKVGILVKDGIIQLDELKDSRISRQQLYATIRGKKIYNLGQVKRLYIEACGVFSIYTYADEQSGLSVLPPRDPDLNMQEEREDALACSNCGNVVHKQAESHKCKICGTKDWTVAVRD